MSIVVHQDDIGSLHVHYNFGGVLFAIALYIEQILFMYISELIDFPINAQYMAS